MPNLNLVPLEFRPVRFTFILVVALLVVVAAAATGLSSYRDIRDKNDLSSDLKARLLRIEDDLPQARAILVEASRIRQDISNLKKQASDLQGDVQALNAKKVAWSQVLDSILKAAPPQVSLTAVTLDGGRATLSGQSRGIDPLLSYREALGQAPGVAAVANFKTQPTSDPAIFLFEMNLEARPGGP